MLNVTRKRVLNVVEMTVKFGEERMKWRIGREMQQMTKEEVENCKDEARPVYQVFLANVQKRLVNKAENYMALAEKYGEPKWFDKAENEIKEGTENCKKKLVSLYKKMIHAGVKKGKDKLNSLIWEE